MSNHNFEYQDIWYVSYDKKATKIYFQNVFCIDDSMLLTWRDESMLKCIYNIFIHEIKNIFTTDGNPAWRNKINLETLILIILRHYRLSKIFWKI